MKKQMENEAPRRKKKLFVKANGDVNAPALITSLVLGLIGVIILITTVGEFFQVIQPSHKGLKISGGELQEQVLEDGFHMKAPFWTEIVPVFIGTLSTDEDSKGNFIEESPFRNIQPLSKDGQVLDIDVQVNYNIVDAKLFREKTGSTDPRSIEQLLFIPTLRRLVYDYASEYGWKSLIQEGDRQEFGQRVFDAMALGQTTKRTCKEEYTKVDSNTGTEIIIEAGCAVEDKEIISQSLDYGVAITAVNFKKIKPNVKIIAAVEEAQAKEQEVKIAAQEAEIEKEKANKVIETMRGETESAKLVSAAKAYELRVLGEEEAMGISALAKAERERALALAASQQLVEYKKLEIEMKKAEALVEFGKNWGGDVPTTMSIIGTDEARDMQLFYGMSPMVTAN